MADIKDRLLEQLKERNTKYYLVPKAIPGEEDRVGIYGGQLYHLIRESKGPEDPRREDELKRPILTLLLGEGNLHIVEHKGKE